MPYFEITDFKGGLDVRRSKFTSVAGTLRNLVNAHITRGGDIERRKAFVDKGSLGASTFGLASDVDGKVTFGSVADPGASPDGVRYMRLVPPSGAAMTGLDAVTVFGGKLYVAAHYDDGMQWHFYDGHLVGDWNGGLVLAGQDNTTIAETLRALIDADGIYSAVRAGNVVTVTGAAGDDFDYDQVFVNKDGGVDDQALTISEVSPPATEVAAQRATAQFAILSGSTGSVTVVDVVVGGVTKHLLSASVAFNGSPEQTASDVASAINTGMAVHGYRAKAQYGKVFIDAPLNGSTSGVLNVTATGDIIMYQGGMAITGGTAQAGVNQVTSITANGVEILGAAVNWTTSHAVTAAALAAQINSFQAAYNARAEGNTLFVSPRSISSNGATAITIVGTTAGNVTFDGGSAPSITQQYPDYDNPPILGGGGVGGRNGTSIKVR